MPLKEVHHSVSERRGHAMPCHPVPRRVTRGSTGVGQEAEGGRGEHGPGPPLWFLWEGMGRARQASLSKVRTGGFESCRQALGYRGALWLPGTWSWGG